MIDRAARNRLANAIDRHLRNEIDYGQLWDVAFGLLGESEDDAVNAVCDRLPTNLPRMSGSTLWLCLAFLKSDREYG